MEEQRHVRVVVPRRAVHERIQRVAIDDEVPLARDEEELAAAAGEVSAGELIEPDLSGGSWYFATGAGGASAA